ncbi:MAG: alpha/beta hydrolase [Bacteroidetes bacterium]|jgi:predicted alpha/beta superfamily hydrolase|nr:alpha/beta hydrolase [Bacteroidota bacterium]
MKLIFHYIVIGMLYVTPAFCQQQKAPETSKPFVLGSIEEFESKILGENRILNIYLPEGYIPNDTTRYPVVYLLDGSADEDFIHTVGLFQFNTFSWIDRVPKSIIIGIATVDRRRDFTFPSTIESEKKNFPTTGHSDKFISFLEEELKPFINNKYKTNSSAMLIGQSLGGLLASEILLKRPEMFNKYLIISPSIWWDNGSLLNQSSQVIEKLSQKTDVYIGVGKEGLTPGEFPRVMEVDANLLVEKLNNSKNKNIAVYFDYLPDEDHATISHQAIFNGLRMLYPVKKEVK